MKIFSDTTAFSRAVAPWRRNHHSMIPSEGIVAVAMSNRNDALPALAFDEMLLVLLPQYRARRGAARDPEAASATPFRPTPRLLGEWRGKVVIQEREAPITFTFKEGGDVHVRLGQQLIALLNDVALRDDRLTGRMVGDLVQQMPFETTAVGTTCRWIPHSAAMS